MATTASTIANLARNLLKTESTSEVPTMSDAVMVQFISDGNLKWARAFRSNGNAPIVFQRETGFDLVAETAINNAAGTTTSSTTITVDAQTFPDAAGVAMVWDDNMPDLFSYTSQTSTLFSGVTGLGFAHEDNDAIHPLYKLPTNFGGFRGSGGYGDGVRLNGLPLYFMGGVPAPGYFSMYDDGTSKYLWLPRYTTGSASVFYDKLSTTIDSTDDTVDVPDEYMFFLVWYCVAYGLMGREQDMNKMMAAQQQSDKILQEALEDRNVGKKIRTRPFGRMSRDYVIKNGSYVSL